MADEDYLWDRSGPVDPDIARLERLLRGHALAAPQRAPHALRHRAARGDRRARWRRTLVVAAAMLALCAVGTRAWFQHRLHWQPGAPWEVVTQHGDVRIDGLRRGADAHLPQAGTLVTGANATARLRAAGIGEVALGAGSRLRLVETRSGRHRVRLEQGSLWARVWAPPGQFGVGIAGADVIDLGCEFLLRVDADGDGSLSVLSGWVQVDDLQREVLVPQGTQVRLRGGRAAGTPRAQDASAAFVAALDAIDAQDGAVAADGKEIRRLAAAARPADAISLLSLLRDHPDLGDGPLFYRLAQLLPSVPAPERSAWRTQRGAVLNAWWDALPYPRMKRWWMQWPDAFPSRGGKMAYWLQLQHGG